LRKRRQHKHLDHFSESLNVPENPARSLKNPEPFRVEIAPSRRGRQLDLRESEGSPPNPSISRTSPIEAEFSRRSVFLPSWIRLVDVGPRRAHFGHRKGEITEQPDTAARGDRAGVRWRVSLSGRGERLSTVTMNGTSHSSPTSRPSVIASAGPARLPRPRR
jgi:hypothetical protein